MLSSFVSSLRSRVRIRSLWQFFAIRRSARQKGMPTFYYLVCVGFLFLGFATSTHAATYYVSLTGSNTVPYDTWAKAANLPSTALTAGNAVNGPHIMYIAPGTYDDYLNITNIKWASGQIIGTSASGATTPAAKGQVILTQATTNYNITVGVGSLTINNLSLTQTNVSGLSIFLSQNLPGTFVGDNLYIYDGADTLLYANPGAVNAVITNSLFEGMSKSNRSINLAHTSGTITFSNCIFRASNNHYLGDTTVYDAIGINTTGTLTINNSLISGYRRAAISSVTGNVVNLNNNIILPSSNGGLATLIQTGTGTLNLQNNIILRAWYGRQSTSGTLNTDTNNIYNISNIFFTKQQRVGYIIPTVDDAANSTYAKMLESELSSHAVKGEWAAEAYSAVNVPSNKTEIQAMINRGVMSIAHHGYSHTDLTLTGNVMTITKAGATINVDRTGNIITVTPGGTVASFKTKSLVNIKAELEALGCTAIIRAGLTDTSLGEIMTDSGGAQVSPYSPQLLIDSTDATGFFNVELVQARALMEANFTGLTLISLFNPGSANNDTVRTATKNAGLWGSRSIFSNSGNNFLLNSINVYGISHYQFNTYFRGVTDADTLANIHALLEAVSSSGMVISILAHNTTQATQTEWQMLLDAAAQYSTIKVTDMDTLLGDIRSSWTTSDDITYNKTPTDQSNYNLLPTSPAIDAGINVGLATDYVGNPIYGTPDIGAYEYQPPHNLAQTTPDTIDIGAGARIYADGRFRDLATTSVPSNPANLKIAPSGGTFATYTETTARPAWLDITAISSWTTSHKAWTESNAVAGLTNALHTVGDLDANRYYAVKRDDVVGQNITGDSCTAGVCLSNSSGQIIFTYTGTYSSHTFDMTELDQTKAITAFSFQGLTPAVTATINGTTISATVPYNTPVNALVATFTTTGASVKVGSTVQTSGTTPNNFASPVTYTVTAADSSTQDYTATVTVASDTTSATVVSSSANPSTIGDSVTFTATVTPSAATGTVTFKDGETTLGTGSLSSGTATYATSSLAVGDHTITAVYGGDSNYTGSTSSPVTQTVSQVLSNNSDSPAPTESSQTYRGVLNLPTSSLLLDQAKSGTVNTARIVNAVANKPLLLSSTPPDTDQVKQVWFRSNGKRYLLKPSGQKRFVVSVLFEKPGKYPYALTVDYGSTTRTEYGTVVVAPASTPTPKPAIKPLINKRIPASPLPTTNVVPNPVIESSPIPTLAPTFTPAPTIAPVSISTAQPKPLSFWQRIIRWLGF